MKMLEFNSYKHVHDAGAYVAIAMHYKRDTLVVSTELELLENS